MKWKALLVLTTAAVAYYRVWILRRRNVPAMQALGLSFDRTALQSIFAGAAFSFFAVAMVFLFEALTDLLTIERIGPPSALLSDLVTSLAVPLIPATCSGGARLATR